MEKNPRIDKTFLAPMDDGMYWSTRTKWCKERKNLHIDVVLVISSENKRVHWPMGRVIETYMDTFIL